MDHPFSDHKLHQEIKVAIEAVRLAGQLCRKVQSGSQTAALAKDDRSPVTVADFGSQALICRSIGAQFPSDPVIGEEDSAALVSSDENGTMLATVTEHVSALVPGATSTEVCQWIDRGGAKEYSSRFWTLDPIDGTKGFLRGMQYAIALALIIDGKIEAGIVGCPNMGPTLQEDAGQGTLFAAIRGAGTFAMPLDGNGAPTKVTVSDCQDPSLIRFCESFEAAHSSHSDSARLAQHLAITAAPARLDSQAKYGAVCRGEAEAYLRLPRDDVYREKIWDHAGGVLVVTEAGGKVTDIHGQDLDFTLGYRLENNRGVVVTNGHVHQAVLDALSGLGIGR
jgi:3'(2'), 5'-bisphosphate nucleotidase